MEAMVPGGACTVSETLIPFLAQLTTIAPKGVGTWPLAQVRLPNRGATVNFF
jgi:hypothetical protein